MGYTTNFSGVIELSKPIPLKLAKYWLDLAEGGPVAGGPGSYLQWVPTEDLGGIVWDGNEKFYDYTEWMVWVVKNLLIPNGIIGNGRIAWSGEEVGDNGVLTVTDNAVEARKNITEAPSSSRPLTHAKLADLVLETL